jgi:CheY-like chemotaxis protein
MGTISIMTDIQFVAAKDYKSRQFSMTPSEDGDYVTLEIRDDGIGMNKETLANIFDPFFTTKEKGHGLGLAAVLGIIKGHNGGLMVTSEVGVGTTFKILLPASTDYEADDLEHPSTRSLNGAGLVLVIDDEPHVRMAVSDILKLKNIKSILASDGQQGLALYQEHQKEVGLVLLDLSMPGWSGEQTMRELYKFDPDVSIILSSGYNEVEATRLFVGDGLVGFLQKPYSAAKLLDTVATYIG